MTAPKQSAITLKPKEEVAVISEILQDPTYATADDMAKALLKAMYGLWRQRDWFAFGVIYRGKPFRVYGLEGTELAAWKAAEDLPYRDKAVWPIRSFDQYLEDREEAIQDAQFVPNPDCVNCGHGEWQHYFVDGKGKRTFPKAAKSAPKCSTDCACEKFVSEEMAARDAAHEEQESRRKARQVKAKAA